MRLNLEESGFAKKWRRWPIVGVTASHADNRHDIIIFVNHLTFNVQSKIRFMEKHHTLTDTEFERQFANCTLDPALFSHEAHLRLAWIHISKYGVDKAIKNVCDQIQAFATANGADGKYHVTLTVAAVRAVYHFVLKSTSTDFAGFIAEFPRLKFQFKELLDCHYSMNLFKSELAREVYLEPDLAPFD